MVALRQIYETVKLLFRAVLSKTSAHEHAAQDRV